MLFILFHSFVDLHNQFESTTAQDCVKKLNFSNVGMYTNQIKVVCKIFYLNDH